MDISFASVIGYRVGTLTFMKISGLVLLTVVASSLKT